MSTEWTIEKVMALAPESGSADAVRFVPDALTITEYYYDIAGRILQVKKGTDREQYKYDDLGRISDVLRPDNSIANNVTYSHDDLGQRSGLTYPGGMGISYQYDDMGRLLNIFYNGEYLPLAQYTYDTLSRRTSVTYANGTSMEYDYVDNESMSPSENNLGDWLESIVNNVPNSNPTTAPFGYAYDKVGNRQAINDGTTTHTYDYDNIYQLLSDTIGLNNVLTLAYDAVGSRTQTTTYQNPPLTYLTTSNELNQYDQVGATVYSYDTNGNLSNDGLWTYTYDKENRLTAAVTPSITAGYGYDAQGRQISKTVSGVTTRYAYDGDQIIAEYDNANDLVRKYIYGPGIDEPICMITVSGTTETRYFYHYDGLGSVIGLSNSAGAFVERYEYDTFGSCSVHMDAGPDGIWMTADDTRTWMSPLGNPFEFTGRQFDWETGLYYYRARMYSPSLGRFLQTDPIGYADSMNPCRY